MDDLISRQALLEEYDRLHVGEPGRARKLIEDAPSAQPEPCGEMVSREVVVKFFDDWMSALDINCHHQSVADLRIIKGDIKNLPSAQSEIIRCKDCRYWKKYGYINGKPEFLPKCGFNQIYTSKDDFCSRAERKNNG